MREHLRTQIEHDPLTDKLHGHVLQKLADKRTRQHRNINERDPVQSLILADPDEIVDHHLGEVRADQVQHRHRQQQQKRHRHQQPVRFQVAEDALEQGPVIILVLQVFFCPLPHFSRISISLASVWFVYMR